MLLLLLLLHFAGFRKPKVFKRFDFVQRFFLFSFLDFSLLLCSLSSLSLSLYKQNFAHFPSTAGSRSNLNENPSSLVAAAGFYSNSNQHSSVNPRSWVVGEQRSVDLGQEEFWV
jgi:hypothetical protein